MTTRAEQTRRRLMEHGARAFARFGHDRVNLVRDILEPAGIGPGSFYHQFSDKTDLLVAIIEDAAERRVAHITAFEADTVEEFVEQLTERFFESLDRDDHWWRIQSRERASAEPRIRKRILRGRAMWIDLVETRLSALTDAPPACVHQAAVMIVTTAVGLVAIHLDQPPTERRRRRPELVDSATRYITAGTIELLTSR